MSCPKCKSDDVVTFCYYGEDEYRSRCRTCETQWREDARGVGDERWVDINLPYYVYEGDSFEARGLNKPGTLIETDRGTFLIGHINPNRGVCDDCTEFAEDTIVKRYKIIWKEKED